MIRIIFLDVDGVLNSINHLIEVYNETHRPHSGFEYPFDEKCLNNLKIIVEETDAYLVITSTWRKNIKGRRKLLSKLKEYGLDKRVIGFTPIIGSREEEIKEYLSGVNVEYQYVIVDDDIVLDDNFVHINTRSGITNDDTNEIIKKLTLQ